MREPGEGLWLSADQQRAWLSFILSSRFLVAELDRQLQRDAGIPHAWYALLVVLSDRPDRTARQSDLAGTADFSLSRLSHAVNRLTAKGWVERRPDPSDRRAGLVRLTDTGVEALARIAPGHVAAVRELFFGRLTAEQVGHLDEACRAILSGLPGAPGAAGSPQGAGNLRG